MASPKLMIFFILIGFVSVGTTSTLIAYDLTDGFSTNSTKKDKKDNKTREETPPLKPLVKSYSMSDAIYTCEVALKKKITKNLTGYYLDDNASWQDEDSEEYKIFYKVTVGSSGKRAGFTGNFNCHIPMATNKIRLKELTNKQEL